MYIQFLPHWDHTQDCSDSRALAMELLQSCTTIESHRNNDAYSCVSVSRDLMIFSGFVPSHYLNQWVIINWCLQWWLQWYSHMHLKIFLNFEPHVCPMTISSWSSVFLCLCDITRVIRATRFVLNLQSPEGHRSCSHPQGNNAYPSAVLHINFFF